MNESSVRSNLTFAFDMSTPLSQFIPQVDRLMELYFKYLEGVQQADKRIEGEKHVSIPFFTLPSLLPYQSAPPVSFFLFSFFVLLLQIIRYMH